MSFPCDSYMSNSDETYFRAIDVDAPASVLFRWLCQLKAAPYSYDWLDNFGRQSPRELIPGVEDLAFGQRVMTIFKLVEFEQDQHLTVLLDFGPAVSIFGHIALSYVVLPITESRCRLVVKMHLRYPTTTIWGAWVRFTLPWGDWLMMRKQFLTLKHLAEKPGSRVAHS
ncbi:MAG: hypothetical protein ACPGWR_14840 [Ardenticatenaceae bacterium]